MGRMAGELMKGWLEVVEYNVKPPDYGISIGTVGILSCSMEEHYPQRQSIHGEANVVEYSKENVVDDDLNEWGRKSYYLASVGLQGRQEEVLRLGENRVAQQIRKDQDKLVIGKYRVLASFWI
ncbi:unnamed protein product [Vicia faba]|uniref:Uncharacterized protein n=1 Tax=Vicia faba TaxID=3906 RepID=A0AAV1A0Y4_VICFA|nr:unnamed protein product [Vicia faba]